ncbi:glycoside hydrolase family 97 protein [Sphingobacterium psychroaquaticum]|uniref:Glycosyl-hydrolase 97 C-terminal, oligomerisation n=1 Tax=Sphingobacterium psychroaquaticum TaxID=561061 RepID=A0A1X7JM05_9SPHI|nr:glycoside hydrolase family 97 protein [Sphingobacterium psychroaquaticum]SMG28955.1 Glycosyl-hydrolase 97 C-terminal, oligomerisation [Sphingobacterium psychroaquaticum]
MIETAKSKFLLTCTVWASLALQLTFGQSQPQIISSPNKTIKLKFWLTEDGKPYYSVTHKNRQVLEQSALGLVMDDLSFQQQLTYVATSPPERIEKTYESVNAKRKLNSYRANKRTIFLENAEKKKINIQFQVSDDGLAFRYEVPAIGDTAKEVTAEYTSYKFPTTAQGWLQPVAVAKSGWEHTNPSYEEHYQKEIPVGTLEETKKGWVYPALFKTEGAWVLISEAGLASNHAATRLHHESPNGEYRLAFPDPRETMQQEKGIRSKAEHSFVSPWRIAAIGSLATIVESNLGQDLLDGPIKVDNSFIKPGKSSWSWINSKDDFIVYEEQKKYIDFAADMKWQYCLIDVNWDTKIGYEKMQQLANYAKDKNIGLLLWYNSAGDWNTVGYTPKNKLLLRESRRAEFQRIHEMGIKGVKIDFFGGDGQSVIQYYIDILNDAADYKLLVNFHGATLPRGWSRQYPHLMTVEAVRGFENVTFQQVEADRQAEICTIIPFSRNVFDPMDYTPMNLYKVPSGVQRRTTAAFELATSVLFLSGIQHFAESPEGMSHIHSGVQDFLRELPVSWDEVKFLSGYPGKEVVIARRAGKRWYVAGINGENVAKEIEVDLTALKTKGSIQWITDSSSPAAFDIRTSKFLKKHKVAVKAQGGFVMVIE